LELLEIAENVYVTNGSTRIGVVADDDRQVAIVDAGLDDGSGKKLKVVLDRHGFALRSILITHGHADHFGAAAWLAESTGAKVYAHPLEKPIIECPILEPMYLFGGANPPRELRTKFYLAHGVKVNGDLIQSEGTNVPQEQAVPVRDGVVSEWDLEIVDLSGHTPGQVGVAVSGVLFCADAFIGRSVLEKHGIPLNMDIGAALDTCSRLQNQKHRVFVPSHGDVLEDVTEVVAQNRQRVLDVTGFIEEFVCSPKSIEDIIAAVCDRFNVRVKDLGMFYLMNLTVAAHVSYLMGQKRAFAAYRGNRQYISSSPTCRLKAIEDALTQ
jgi:glyoxylase-like metal-dependent hydrolase (beta-lactamase superfamily II)